MQISKGAMTALKAIASTGDYGILIEHNGRMVATDGVSLLSIWNDRELEGGPVVLKDMDLVKDSMKGMKKSEESHILASKDSVTFRDLYLGPPNSSDRDSYPDYKALDDSFQEVTVSLDLKRLKQVVSAVADATELNKVELTFMSNGTIRLQTEDEVKCYLMPMV